MQVTDCANGGQLLLTGEMLPNKDLGSKVCRSFNLFSFCLTYFSPSIALRKVEKEALVGRS